MDAWESEEKGESRELKAGVKEEKANGARCDGLFFTEDKLCVI